jgi:hypothetical protein
MMLSKFKSKQRLKLFYAWLIVGGLFYVVDCLVVTYAAESRLDLPWFERGMYAGGPAGISTSLLPLADGDARRWGAPLMRSENR